MTKTAIKTLFHLTIILTHFLLPTMAVEKIEQFNKAYAMHTSLISQQKYAEALPFAKQSYQLSKDLFASTHDTRMTVTDNYALNLKLAVKPLAAHQVFIELLALYEQRYGQHAKQLIPILTDITQLDEQLTSQVDKQAAKARLIRKYKLYLRHHSDEFVAQFVDPVMPTTQHAKNTLSKIQSHFETPFAIYETKHWSIIHPPEQLKFVKQNMARLIEKTYQNNISFLVALGLRNKPIDHKMTAVYLPSKKDYQSYIKEITRDSYAANNSGGIYSPKAKAIFVHGHHKRKNKRANPQTVAHEVTHQVMIETGLQSLHVVYPRWFTEGLAACFEFNNIKMPFGPHTQNFAFRRVFPLQKPLQNNSLITLKQLVTFDGDDESFDNRQNQNDIYALGSMLIRFLYTHYPDQLKDYLAIIAKSRSALYERAKFGKEIRLKQFVKAFGPPENLQEEFDQFINNAIHITENAFAQSKKNK